MHYSLSLILAHTESAGAHGLHLHLQFKMKQKKKKQKQTENVARLGMAAMQQQLLATCDFAMASLAYQKKNKPASFLIFSMSDLKPLGKKRRKKQEKQT